MAGPRNRAGSRPPGQLRIIGGDWRSRRIPFAADTGVRPTPDRIRETLFNWLREVIPGARCLDLFAGSGALGFEALSRGAAAVHFIDEDIRVVQQIQANLEMLGSHNGTVVWSDAFRFLAAREIPPFDVVFLDPPFRQHILGKCAAHIEQTGALTTPAWIYLEADRNDDPPELPDNWQVIREQTSGQVICHLCRRESPA